MKKFLATLLALVLVLSMMPTVMAEQEEVKIVYAYNSNGMQTDTALINEEMNKWLDANGLGYINLELRPCLRDLADTITLAQASGEQIDMCNSYNTPFADYVQDGYAIALDELLAGTEIANELPAWLLDLGKYNGTTYFIPNLQNPGNMKYLSIPTEYVKYYEGGAEAMREITLDPECTIDDILDIVETTILAVREGTGKETKWVTGNWYPDHSTYYDSLVSRIIVVVEGTTEAVSFYEYEDYYKPLKRMAEWYTEGIVHPDIATLTNSDFTGANHLNDASAVMGTGQNMRVYADECDTIITTVSNGIEFTHIPVMDHYYTGYTWAAGGNWITATCEHPEEAMKIIELLNTDKGTEFFNLLVYGIEGRQYTKNEDGTIKTLEYDGSQGGSSTTYMCPGWEVGNTTNQYLNQGFASNYVDLINSIGTSELTQHSQIAGILFDNVAIADQIAQLQAVETEYWSQLTTGITGENFDTVYAEFIAKLNAAGLQTVLDHINAQIDAFVAAK